MSLPPARLLRVLIPLTSMHSYDMYKDIEGTLAEQRGETFTAGYIHGLPVGLKLPNGVVIGD